MVLQNISVEKFKALMDRGDHIVLDVRTETEYEEGQIPNHILIDYFSNNFNEELNKLDKQANYLVYCRAGIRSEKSM